MRIVLIVAQSLDGFITKHDTPGTAWTSAADKAWFSRGLAPFDATVMGRVTYETIRTQLLQKLDTTRTRIVLTSSPAQFKIDAKPNQLEFTANSAPDIAAQLAQSGRKQCAILGGTRVHDEFLRAHLVDEIWTTIEPRLFGTGTPVTKMPHDITLSLREFKPLEGGDSLLLKYEVQR